jgi:hypothetical protein
MEAPNPKKVFDGAFGLIGLLVNVYCDLICMFYLSRLEASALTNGALGAGFNYWNIDPVLFIPIEAFEESI